jgi:hypothetical protein
MSGLRFQTSNEPKFSLITVCFDISLYNRVTGHESGTQLQESVDKTIGLASFASFAGLA